MKSRWIAGCVLIAGACGAHAAGNVVISQVYGAGSNNGATYQNDFVELFNRSSAPVNLAGWTVQYGSATGTGNFSANGVAALSGILQPGQYYLVKLAGGTTAGVPLPVAADATAASPNLSGTTGKVVLVSGGGLACNGGSNPCSPAQLAQIVDLVGYGASNFSEGGSPASTLSITTAAFRLNAGCTDTDINSADFTPGTPVPRNTASPLSPCGSPSNAPVIASCPTNFAVELGTGGAANLSASDADGFVTSAAITSSPVSGITLGTVAPGATLTTQLLVSGSALAGNYPVAVTFTNSDTTPQTASCTIAVNVAPPSGAVRIHDIQGAAHLSPFNGQSVNGVPGIVTAVKSNGFYLQDPSPDANEATSEGIFVFTSGAPTVSVGDSVKVTGTVSEFRPGGSDGLTNLTTTEIVSPVIVPVSSGNTLPAPIVIGAGGRQPPTVVIDDDATGDVETSGTFQPATDGIDFFESLEGMLVRVNNPVAVGPTNSFGETALLADGGAGSTLRTSRGGVVISATDFNPDRIIITDGLVATPVVNVGATLASFTAVVDYGFGNFMLSPTAPIAVTSNSLTAETTAITGGPSNLTVASYNVENLAATNPASKFAGLAAQIVSNLHSPDIVALMEVQDNNGATDNGVVDASQTFSTLLTAIQNAGGPAYEVRSINPVNDQDGGEPGGNIRVAFMFNPARVSFTDRAGGTSTSPVTVNNVGGAPQLSASPGRIAPTNTAWNASRKPLAGEFVFNGRRLFLVANHFNSKGGDDPLFGHAQPPVRSSEVQRHQQAALVNGFVKNVLTVDANAGVVVLGDLNDFQFSDTLSVLKDGNVLQDLIDTLPANERYSYVFEGNSQVLDHTLVSNSLATYTSPVLDVVHANAEFAAQTSDHDPDVVRFTLPKAGDVDGDGDIDRNDISAITAARNTNPNGPFDPRDANGDGRIDLTDVRFATTACTRPGCAVQ
ncbi:MAG: lamin tail domain-containing protein [Gammaproteobacteria bacterium]